MTIALILTTTLALLLWPLVFVWNLSLNDSDAAGNGLAAVYTVAATVVLWVLLGLSVLLASLRTALPAWQPIAALVLLPLSGAAALAVTQLLSSRDPVRWMLLIQALVPPIVLATVVWAAIPRQAAAIGWSLIFVLGLIPWTRVMNHAALREQHVAAVQAESDERMRRFNQLTPESPVRDWMQFLDIRYGLHDDTVRKIKDLSHKQSDIEHMLNGGDYTGFESIWEFDLTPAPALCDGARKFLRDQSIALKPSSQRRRYSPDVQIAVDSYLNTLRWFAQNGCPMLDELEAFEATLRTYPDSAKDVLSFGSLDEMRRQLRR